MKKSKEYKLEVLSKELNQNYKRDVLETTTTTNIEEIQEKFYKAVCSAYPINFYVNNVCKNSTIAKYIK